MSLQSPYVTYEVKLSPSSAHTLEVALHIPSPEKGGQRLSLPAWIPGSYMIRDFARNIIQLRAVNAENEAIEVTQTDKQHWQLAHSNSAVTVYYDVYAYDLSIRSAYICDEYAFFNGTSVFLRVVGQEDSISNVIIDAPLSPIHKDWQVATALKNNGKVNESGFGQYFAENYDELLDHPVLMGQLDVLKFTQSGVDFELVFAGGHHADTGRIVEDLKKICRHHIELFADMPPVSRYLFLTLLTDDGFGGLEHRDSTALLYSREDLPQIYQKNEMTEGYRTFLSLCSHELFHTWHVKRIRPEELKASELLEETYTEQLWIYEGFTSYYDDLSLVRSGIIQEQDYLELMGQNLTRLLRNRGRLKQSVTESSFNAWTKFYKQDDSAINNIVSYYNKGAVLAMCLDLLIRQSSEQEKSLDDVMRVLWQQFGRPDVGTKADVIQCILSDFDLDLDDFLHQALYTTQELPVNTLLNDFGVELNKRPRLDHKEKGGKPATKGAIVEFGANFKGTDTGVKITQIFEASPAQQAGIQTGDQLLAINHWQVSADNLQHKLDTYVDSQSVCLYLLRDKKLKLLEMDIRPAPLDTVYLTINDQQKLKNWFVKG